MRYTRISTECLSKLRLIHAQFQNRINPTRYVALYLMSRGIIKKV